MTPASNQRLHDFGDRVLLALDKRRKGDDLPAVQVKHLERDANGWACAETANFRIFHNQSRELAEQVAQTAEHTRKTMADKWFGGFKDDWSPRCDIYLHATAQDYARSTGASNGSPGHSSFKTDGARVLVRRIDLHCDDPKNMLHAVLPHEATHVVLAGQFGDHPIPRWADEGIAVLTEPREKIDRHLRNLVRCREEIGLFTVEQMMKMADYPQPKYITVFYAQSVSLVEFMADIHGPETFTKFLHRPERRLRVGPEEILQVRQFRRPAQGLEGPGLRRRGRGPGNRRSPGRSVTGPITGSPHPPTRCAWRAPGREFPDIPS